MANHHSPLGHEIGDFFYIPIAGPWANLTGLSLEPEQKSPTSRAETYFADEHAVAAYGLRLIKGRNFQTSEVVLGIDRCGPESRFHHEGCEMKAAINAIRH
jgi:hypothetical protein